MSTTDGYIIIVDDDEDDISYLEDLLLRSGISTFLSFLSGTDLINYLQTSMSIPALIILDYNMPKQNGLEVLMQIRAMPTHQQVPVVCLSTGTQKARQELLLQAGATACYLKPYNIVEAEQTIAAILAHIKTPAPTDSDLS